MRESVMANDKFTVVGTNIQENVTVLRFPTT